MKNLRYRKNKLQTAFLNALKREDVYGNVKLACTVSGVSRRTIYRYREQDTAFRINWDNIVNGAKYHLTDEAAHALLLQIRRGKISAITFALTTLRPEKWSV